ncbi:DUF2726 domain-containing protein [Ferrimonas balearica]|uniref:DUF2726 domain-containing protein n=1 Tax=Ferrimonas balearica TaxID=44012 RepID=UPI001C9963B4|nr:DUF2726 domain-containing protein [Ferrimonas balearica]MBY5922013.1 DUF2726 domain-containing protein [Ferrimonas balearica]MBY5994647.1 DUF2726 domain-containing protein [Ferrimonas balearica]
MEWLILFGLLLVLLSGLNAYLNRPAPSRYIKRGPLLTPAERSFYGVLQTAITQFNASQSDSHYQLFAKVRIADVVKPDHKQGSKDWIRAFRKVSQKHFDFVLCDSRTTEITLAIELDDNSHQRSKTQKRDALVESVCEIAELPLKRLSAKRSYQVGEIIGELFGDR